jgi:16S rRNA (uracil1498-N3)-methyltransferase
MTLNQKLNGYRLIVQISIMIMFTLCKLKVKDFTKLPRVYINHKLQPGEEIQLDLRTHHYLRTVLRIGKDGFFRLFNENYGEYLSSWSPYQNKLQDKAIILEQICKPFIRTTPSFTLYFTPIKNSKLKSLLDSCTQFGVRDFVPVATQNMVCHYDDFDAFSNRLRESVEQSEQLIIPKIHSITSLNTLLNNWITNDHDFQYIPTLFICRERMSNNQSFSSIIHESVITPLKQTSESNYDVVLPGGGRGVCGVLIGPEGGFTQQELNHFESYRFTKFVSLGPSVLRSEIASIAAVSILTDVNSNYSFICYIMTYTNQYVL